MSWVGVEGSTPTPATLINEYTIYLQTLINYQVITIIYTLINISYPLMGCFKSLKNLLAVFDSFPHNKFLTYKSEQVYKTATGGVASILIIILVLLLVINEAQSVFGRQKVTYSTDFFLNTNAEPESSTVQISKEGGFMFMFRLPSYFLHYSTDLTVRTFDYYLVSNGSIVPMVPCINIDYNFSALGFDPSYYACPEIGQKLDLATHGGFTLIIAKCGASSPDGPSNAVGPQCPQTYYSGSQVLSFKMVNTQVNPAMTDNYLSTYIEDFSFVFYPNSQSYVSMEAQLSDYTVTTDESLFPVQSLKVEKGFQVSGFKQQIKQLQGYKENYYNWYSARINFVKDQRSVQYIRKFQRVDELLAYIGGLIASIISAAFLISAYNSMCFNLSAGSKLMLDNQKKKIDSGSFNILTYLWYLLQKVVSICSCCQMSPQIEILAKTRQEVIHQFDVVFMIRRLFYLERCVTLLLPEHYTDLLHLQRKPTIEEIKEGREKYRYGYKLANKVKEGDTADGQDGQGGQGSSTTRDNPLREHLQVEGQPGLFDEISQSQVSEIRNSSINRLRERMKLLDQGLKDEDVTGKKVASDIDPRYYGFLKKDTGSAQRARDEVVIELQPMDGQRAKAKDEEDEKERKEGRQ